MPRPVRDSKSYSRVTVNLTAAVWKRKKMIAAVPRTREDRILEHRRRKRGKGAQGLNVKTWS